jgi:hypothetical protein
MLMLTQFSWIIKPLYIIKYVNPSQREPLRHASVENWWAQFKFVKKAGLYFSA